MIDSDILRAFESLGDNCEFGLVQSSLGIEQLGFFRFNSVSTGALLRALDSEFADFEDLTKLDIEIACNDELIVHIPAYDLRYHTFYSPDGVDIDRLRHQQKTVVRFLARKLREDLSAAEKIFVRKSATDSLEEITAIHQALRRYGNATLLWVTLAGDDGRIGEVEMLRSGLLKGYIDRFSDYADATAASFAWFNICRIAYMLSLGTGQSKHHRHGRFGNQRYRIVSLSDLASGFIAEVNSEERGSLGFAILNDAIVRGGHGIVTVGDAVIAETLPKAPDGEFDRPLGSNARWIDLREGPIAPEVASAYHLFGGVGEDEECRYQAAVARFQAGVYDRFAQENPRHSSTILLFPDMQGFRVLNALRELAPRHVPRLAIPAHCGVGVQRLCLPYSLLY